MWNLEANRPIYLQIAERIELQICSGDYQPGDKISSVRELAQEAGVNPNTMQRALQELERKGIIVTFRTSGRTVTEDKERIRDMRNHLAKEQIQDFLKKMKEMGFEKEEILEFIREEKGEN